jgi:dCMP deaminase
MSGFELERRRKWDLRFLEMARLVSQWSKDPSTRCGAVIVRPDLTVASVGFNGFPRSCSDDEALYANRDLKYSRVIHAEINAILACEGRPRGCTIYTWPEGLGPSCDRCTACIIQAGILRVVYVHRPSDFADRWRTAVERGLAMYAEANVEVTQVPHEVWMGRYV